jgi:putative ABC transport system substrate-binding protein
MDRRVFLGVVAGGLLAVPVTVTAQPASRKVPLVGLLDFASPDPARLGWWQALRDRLQELGYVEGRSIAFETRWAEG